MKIKFTMALTCMITMGHVYAADVPPRVQAKVASVAPKFVPIGVDGLTIFVPLPVVTPPPSQPDPPKKMAEDFVGAYLAGNDALMQTLTFQDSIDALKDVDEKARYAFEHMSGYVEHIYYHGYKAVVTAQTSILDDSGFVPIPIPVVIKFYFSWTGKQWVLERVI